MIPFLVKLSAYIDKTEFAYLKMPNSPLYSLLCYSFSLRHHIVNDKHGALPDTVK